MRTIYFVTANKKKIQESEARFKRFKECNEAEGVELKFKISIYKKQLDELLDPDVAKIVKKKALEAYRLVLQPCVVEHGGLFLDAWKTPQKPGLLGGIGQVVWDSVGHRMCRFLQEGETRAAVAQSVVGYCDGKRVHVYSGITQGKLTTGEELGVHGFRWDPIFKPAGSDLTYGQMTPEKKRETSPEGKAWDRFFKSVMKELRKS